MIPLSPVKSGRQSSPNSMQSRMKSFLYVMDPPEARGKSQVLDHQQWYVDQTSVRIHDIDNKNQRKPMNFQFDQVFNGSNEYNASSYYQTVAPLVRQVISGEDVMAVFCGPGAMNFGSYLLSRNNLGTNTAIPGQITQAASQLLLASTNTAGEKKATVTFSWFRVDCTVAETIVDILRLASDSKMNSSQSSSVIAAAEQMILREQGRGRGMTVPGLWEVELATTADIESVVSHVLRLVPAADHSKGSFHSILQLTYSLIANQTQTAQSGRILFTVLSDLRPPQGIAIDPSDASSTYPWIKQLLLIIDWIDYKHAAPPFHKSRILLLIRDLLLGRQNGSITLILPHPQPVTIPRTQQWLQFINRMRQQPLQPGAIGNDPSDATFSSEITFPVADDMVVKTSSTASSRPISPTVRINHSVPALNRNSPLPVSQPPPAPQQQSFFGSSLSSIFGSVAENVVDKTVQNVSGPVPPRSSSRAKSPRTQSPRSSSPTHSKKVSLRETLKTVTASESSLTAIHAQLRRDDQNITGISYIQYEEANLLKAAFEALQAENQGLRHRIAILESEKAEHKESYFNLIEQLKEEWAMLEKKDQERYRKARQDVKDYELYKEVMEASMVRISQELNDLTRENEELKQQKTIADINARKNKAFDEKYSRDLTATKKKLQEAESKISQYQQEIRKVVKDRETATSELLQLKAEIKKRNQILTPRADNTIQSIENTAPMTVHWSNEYQSEKEKLNKRIEELEIELTAMETVHREESATMKAAHEKALEQVMKYQEENRMLKSTIAAMLDAVEGPKEVVIAAVATDQSNQMKKSGSATRSVSRQSRSVHNPNEKAASTMIGTEKRRASTFI